MNISLVKPQKEGNQNCSIKSFNMEYSKNITKNNLPSKIKHGLGKQKNRLLGVLLLFMGIILGVGIAIAYPKIASMVSSQSKLNTSVETKLVTSEDKKKALETLFRELTEAESKDNWQKLYTVVNPSDKKWFTIEDMTLQYKKDKHSIVSTEVIAHGVSVSGDVGSVDKTIIKCKTKECTGENKLEKRNNDQFVYVDGQWYRQSIKEPSDKARQLAAYIYNFYKTRNDYTEKLVDKYGGGQDDLSKIIRTIAIMIENDPEYFAYTETWVEKNKAEASRPNVYVDSPDVIQQPVVQQQQPSFNNRINCSSNTIGSYTYTNCY